tara:strand:+ start:156 stop:425 length:270 start_codon:yes stop_codon:yes gene_type:complete
MISESNVKQWPRGLPIPELKSIKKNKVYGPKNKQLYWKKKMFYDYQASFIYNFRNRNKTNKYDKYDKNSIDPLILAIKNVYQIKLLEKN